MKSKNEIKDFDKWLELSREEKILNLFDCPSSWRRKQVQYLWGTDAVGYGDWAQIPSDIAWSEIAKVICNGNCRCSVTMKMKREYISQINLDEFHELLGQVNKPGEFCHIDPDYADREFWAFSSWRNTNFFGGKEYVFTVEKFDENTLLFMLCTRRGSHGDEDGFGVEPDMWTSALFDFNGNIVRPFLPGIIALDD